MNPLTLKIFGVIFASCVAFPVFPRSLSFMGFVDFIFHFFFVVVPNEE
jgi:hypothetical protein